MAQITTAENVAYRLRETNDYCINQSINQVVCFQYLFPTSHYQMSLQLSLFKQKIQRKSLVGVVMSLRFVYV